MNKISFKNTDGNLNIFKFAIDDVLFSKKTCPVIWHHFFFFRFKWISWIENGPLENLYEHMALKLLFLKGHSRINLERKEYITFLFLFYLRIIIPYCGSAFLKLHSWSLKCLKCNTGGNPKKSITGWDMSFLKTEHLESSISHRNWIFFGFPPL